VLASRLAEADPGLSILLIEQGMNNWQVPQIVQPALFPLNLDPGSQYTLFWQGNKAPQLADREPVVPSGGTLGGGSVSSLSPIPLSLCLGQSDADVDLQPVNQLDGLHSRSKV
jgi:choline dehydrogenase-like flavoprotein